MDIAALKAVEPFNEEYVSEILRNLRWEMTRHEFQGATRADWNAGYHAEVLEAERRYFNKPRDTPEATK
jgi:hypothetical protein